MIDFDPQFGVEGYSSTEFQKALQQALPLLEMLVKVGHALDPENSKVLTSSPCEGCSKRNNCGNKPCEVLESQLPAAYGGKGYKENTIDLDLNYFQDGEFETSDDYGEECSRKSQNDTIKRAQKIASSDIFEKYEICKHVFTKKQWETVCLYYKEGKTITQIAKELSKATSTIGDLLNLAKKRKEQYDKKKLKEILELNKKLNTRKAE
jgi:predicted DNA-binding protein YlxM (UPF0122 family)